MLAIFPSVEPPAISERLVKVWQGTFTFSQNSLNTAAETAICGVFLVGVVFDDNTAVHGRTVGGICQVCVIRMDRMGIVRGDHKASCHSGKVILLGSSQSPV